MGISNPRAFISKKVTTENHIHIGFDPAKKGSDQSVRHGFNCVPTVHRKDDRKICDSVTAITTLAIVSADDIHIEVTFSAHIKELQVKVFDVNTNYFDIYRQAFGRSVYLDAKTAPEQLSALEDKLIELIADAKDKAMGAA